MTAKRYTSKDSEDTINWPSLKIYYHEDPTLIDPGSGISVSNFESIRAYPNPFRENITIRYEVDRDESIQIGIYNLLGQQIKQISKGRQATGSYTFAWNGDDRSGNTVPAGMYYIIFVIGEERQVLKIMKSR
jgi:hypothetical protein